MPRDLYLVDDACQLGHLQKFVRENTRLMDEYLLFLKTHCQADSLPRSIIWTDYETASHSISDNPLPAYTNDHRTVMVPNIAVWKSLYLQQLGGYDKPDAVSKLRTYYETLSDHNILQILGHEMAHHSDLFLDETYETEMWFEEGMVEYISRKYFLTEEEYTAQKKANQLLVSLHDEKYGRPPLNDFSFSTYRMDLPHIFYAYWRSFLAIDSLVEALGGNVPDVFRSYHRWYDTGAEIPLETWFAFK